MQILQHPHCDIIPEIVGVADMAMRNASQIRAIGCLMIVGAGHGATDEIFHGECDQHCPMRFHFRHIDDDIGVQYVITDGVAARRFSAGVPAQTIRRQIIWMIQ